MRGMKASMVYTVLSCVSALADTIMFTVLAVYYVQRVGLNPFQLVLVGTVLEGAIVVFEIPTGVVADTYSRRLSVIIGTSLLGLGWVLQSAFPTFGAVLATEAVLGVGYTFLSGATEAWAADEVGESRVGAVFIRGRQAGRVAVLIGIPASIALAGASLALPLAVGGGLYVAMAAFLAVAMPERNFQRVPVEERSTWRGLTTTLRDGLGVIRRSRLLLAVLAVALVAGAASEGLDRLWEAHLLGAFRIPSLGGLKPVAWFGLAALATSAIGWVVTHLTRRRMERATTDPRSTARLLLWLTAGVIGFQLAFALAGLFGVAIATIVLRHVAGSVRGPLYDAWLVQHTDPSARATVLSVASFTDAVGQSGFGPLVGLVGRDASTGTAIVLSALMLTPTLALFAWAGGRGSRPDRIAADGRAGPIPI